MALILLLVLAASGQQLSFPTTAADYAEFYPTAYRDQGGTDWDCGSTFYAGHRGSDFGVGGFAGMDAGRDVVAAADGVVTAAHDGEFDRCTTADCPGGGGFGNHVYIQHADGTTSIYAHLEQFSVSVAIDDEVTCGQLIGQVGSSGFSTGPHLHFEVRDAAGTAFEPFDGACAPGPSRWTGQGVYGGVPDLVCDDPVPCEPSGTISCGAVWAGRNDGPGSTNAHGFYGCSSFAYSGPELATTFATDLDETVTLDLTGLTADLDLYVIDGVACDATDCVAASTGSQTDDEQVVFQAEAGRLYTVLVDGWEGAVSDFSLDVQCAGAFPGDEPTGDTGTPTPPTTPAGTDPIGEAGVVDPGYRRAGCACDAGGSPGWGWLPRRRR